MAVYRNKVWRVGTKDLKQRYYLLLDQFMGTPEMVSVSHASLTWWCWLECISSYPQLNAKANDFNTQINNPLKQIEVNLGQGKM